MARKQIDLDITTAALDLAPINVAFVDTDLRYRFVNRMFELTFRRPREELVGDTVENVIGPKSFENVRDRIARALGGEAEVFSAWYPLLTGELRNFRTSYIPLMDGGEAKGFFVYARDATDELLTQQSLQESERKYRGTFFNAAVGMARMALDGSWLDVNDRFCEILGYDREELVGKTVQDLTHPDDFEREWKLMTDVASGVRDTYDIDKRYLRRDGTPVWGHLTVSTARSDGGDALYYVCVVEDISERKEVEQKLQALNTSLETRVAERTAELTALNQELDAFNYSVSHDLRAPLRAIDGFSQAMEEDYGPQLDEGARHYLGRIRNGATRMSDMIEALLRMSRLTRGELHLEEVDLSAMANELLANLQQEEPERQLVATVADGLKAVGDGRLLRVVMANLLENAWKFTRQREEARIDVGSAHDPESGEQSIFVRDNGAGFDPKYADRLFVPFQRLHSAGEFDGQGIGLATVQRVVHRHNGQIWAQSQEDAGATFYFTIRATPGRQ